MAKKFEVIKYCEKDPYAKKVYSRLFNISQEKNLEDITAITAENVEGANCYLVSSPGSSISSCGLKKGIVVKCSDCHHSYNPLIVSADERDYCPVCGSTNIKPLTASATVIYWLNLLRTQRPNFMVFENVANFVGDFKNNYNLIVREIQSYGYNVYSQKLSAKDFGLPVNCERVIMVCILSSLDSGTFAFPKPMGNTPVLADFLVDCSRMFNGAEGNVFIDRKVTPYLLPAICRDIDQIITTEKPIFNMQCRTGYSDHKIGITVAPTLRASNNTTLCLQVLDTDNGKKYYIKRLSAKEAYKIMGFSESDFSKAWSVCSLTQIYKQAANSAPVNMLYKVFEALYLAMPYLFDDLKVVSLFSGIGSFEKALEQLYKVINITETFDTADGIDNVEIVFNNTMFLLTQLYLQSKLNKVR